MPVAYDPKACVFLLNTNDMTYAMAVGEGGLLCHCYWGERVQQPEDVAQDQMLYPDQEWYQEYAGWGGNFYNQHALKATFADGTRNVLLRYQSHEIQGESLTVAMEDPDLHLQVELRYALYPELNIINRSAKIQNAGKAGVKLENAFSATWRLPLQMHYRLTHLSGAWGREYTVQRQEVQNGSFVMETRTGLSGPEHAPVFLLDDDGRANELSGMVYFGTLQWSGNFKMIVEKDEYDHLSVTGGINDFDFEWPLPPGESFETPIFTAGLSTEGFSGASRLLHRYQRRYLMRKVDADRLLPVVFNAYGTFFADINEEKMMRLVEMADRIGIEAFLIDAGWSGVGEEYQRGMGDWNINKERFPHRMKNISEALHQKGIKFGLWLEPEIAHTKSRLVKEHPDWVLRYPGREPYVIKVNRLVLNFALDEVWQDILQKTIRIIETCGVDYYKMDLNRLAIEYGSPLFPQEQQKTLGVRYVQNLYKFYFALAERFPGMLIENCAGGGRRVDLGMAAFSGRINRSDNQDPLDILKIHEGFTYFMLSKFAGGGCHISKTFPRWMNERVTTTRFQAHVAMMGSMAIGENLVACTEEELDEIAGYIRQHKRLRNITQSGEIYRLASAWEKPYAAFLYVLEDKSEAALFVYGQSMQFRIECPEAIRLAGLDQEAVYQVEGYGPRSGLGLMHAGLQVSLKGDMDSKVISLSRVKD